MKQFFCFCKAAFAAFFPAFSVKELVNEMACKKNVRIIGGSTEILDEFEDPYCWPKAQAYLI
jgi:hypothetical protein